MVERKVGGGISAGELEVGDVLVFDKYVKRRELVTGTNDGDVFVLSEACGSVYHGIYNGEVPSIPLSQMRITVAPGRKAYHEDMKRLRRVGIVA